MNSSSQICSLCSNALFGIVAILFLIFSIVVIILFAPLCLFRWFVSKIALVCRSDLYKILDPLSQINLIGNEVYTARVNIIMTAKIQGKICAEELKAKVTQVFLNSKAENGSLCYPEFKMRVEYWLGYPFWKLEDDFKLEDHFKAVEIPNECSEEEEETFVQNFEHDFVRVAFEDKVSPWGMVLLTSGMEGNSYIIFKAHHALCDGQSMFMILMKVVDNYQPFRVPTVKKSSQFFQFLRMMAIPFRAAFEGARSCAGYIQTTSMAWSLDRKDMSLDRRTIVNSKLINCNDIKSASVKYKVSFTSILMSAVSTGVHNTLKKTNKPIPKDLLSGFPTPLPNHPGTLTNHFAGFSYQLPVADQEICLQECDHQLRQARNSAIPFASTVFLLLISTIPHFIFKRMLPPKSLILAISNFPGPLLPASVQGLPIVDMSFTIFQASISSICLTMCSYNGGVRMKVNADPKIFPTRESAQEFLSEIHGEILRLAGNEDLCKYTEV